MARAEKLRPQLPGLEPFVMRKTTHNVDVIVHVARDGVRGASSEEHTGSYAAGMSSVTSTCDVRTKHAVADQSGYLRESPQECRR